MKLLFALISLLVFSGCTKFLDEKPDVKLQLPTSIAAVQGLLDNNSPINLLTPATGEVSCDDYYLTDAVYNALTSQSQKNMYTWEADVTLTDFPNHWSYVYDVVTAMNVCLESLAKITPAANETADWNNAEGSAYFLRAKCFLTAVGYWAKAYSPTAATDPGIPLRLSSDYNIVSTRASVQDCYAQVISDLKTALPLLPVVPKHVMRPSQPAAYGLLARAYLYMARYDSAAVYADKALALNSTLLNYNTVTTAPNYPLPLFNGETLFYTIMATPAVMGNTKAIVDSLLYRSYDVNDLRKTLFFKNNNNGTFGFRGSYSQSATLFNGVAVDEIMLTKAECLIRLGAVTDGLTVLNNLLQTRWKTATFIPYTAADGVAALKLVLQERRKELIFRDLRWMDLKRLNMEGGNISVGRRIAGKDYILIPNDNRYALPIPATVIALSGMSQNPR